MRLSWVLMGLWPRQSRSLDGQHRPCRFKREAAGVAGHERNGPITMWNLKLSSRDATRANTNPAPPPPIVHGLKLVGAQPGSVAGEPSQNTSVPSNLEPQESKFMNINGIAEGSFRLPGARVHIGRNAQINADIVAADVVILGAVCGSISASGRVEIRLGGSLIGDIVAARVRIEEGVTLHGSVETVTAKPLPLRKSKTKQRALNAAPKRSMWQTEFLEPAAV